MSRRYAYLQSSYKNDVALSNRFFFKFFCIFVLPRIQENYLGPPVACRVDVYNYLYTSLFFWRPASVT
jgi:hypothetical protein